LAYDLGMLNLGRVSTIRDAVKAAQQLAQEEAHDSHMDRRVTRLALGLHLCRELADDIFEEALTAADENGHKLVPHGRLEREHC
jgi:hypothetical protein